MRPAAAPRPARPPRWRLALLAMAATLALAEIAARAAAPRLAAGADDLSSPGAYAAKWAAMKRAGGETIAVLGDSVALGDTLRAHGERDWRARNLDAALSDALAAEGAPARIANFAANGLRPADLAAATRDLLAAGVRRFVVVVGLRGLSSDFEPETARHEFSWRARLDLSCGSALCPQSAAETGASAAASAVWAARGAADLGLRRLLDGPLAGVLTRWRAAGRLASDDHALLIALQAGQRFRSAAIAPDRIQTRALRDLLEAARGAGARVALVYATENPDYLAQLAPPATIEAARAGLAALAAEFPDTTIWIGPDAGAAHDDFVDFVHPGAKGYRRLAGRIAPALVAPQAAPAR